MEHHYILQAAIRLRGSEFLCPLGFVCPEEELNANLKHAHAVRYRMKQVDDESIADWDKADWTPVA
ncbi:MAG: hypothetical protein FWH49_07710 [Clostridiales bacterium]|nr:hypothetical protein [Clostridiales bacterium]